jgi:ABC-type sugar transport system ATPase subunit
MYLQKLFDHMQDEHNIILIQSELQEIFNICQEIAICQDKEPQPIKREKPQNKK